ncbi:hypothetical protein [Novosphingobium sp.]|uniref:hypothetical protein n=1 Tax=Novosphingobium sp. TaxID=1874826 RepID=UPI002B47159E|nr:hypothetical protein [Novosphingobium sp.]HKR93127.1 hypothetical protein [Novosphingobium sp.]
MIHCVAKAEVTDRIGRYLRERSIPDDVQANVIGRLRYIMGLKRKGVEDIASAISRIRLPATCGTQSSRAGFKH